MDNCLSLRRRELLGFVPFSEDESVDAIVSNVNGGFHVAQNVQLSSSTGFYLKFQVLSVYASSTLNPFIGGNAGNSCNISLKDSKVVLSAGSTIKASSSTLSAGDVVEITTSGKVMNLYINGALSCTYDTATSGTDGSIICNNLDFGVLRKYRGSDGTYEDTCANNIALQRIWYKVDNVFVFDLIPKIGSNGVPYMLDTVTGSKYYSETTAIEFSYVQNGVMHDLMHEYITNQNSAISNAIADLPSGYISVPYIVSVTDSSINTGITSASNIIVRAKVRPAKATGDVIVGDTTWGSNDNNDFRIFNYNQRIYFDIKNKRQNGNYMYINNDYDVAFGDNFVYDCTNSTWLFNSVTLAAQSSIIWTGETTVRIFVNGNNAGSRIYYAIIANKKNELLRLMVPCLNTSTNTYGLYDSVTGSFYGSVNTPFTAD